MYTDKNGQKWWRGNLHTHTTKSDGRRSYEDALRLYKDEGYDFLAITDHWVFSEGGEFEGMLLLPGIEFDTQSCGVWHMVGIGCESEPTPPKNGTPQEFIDAINEKNGLAILPHPAWSLEQPSDIAALEGLVATEIYNGVSASINCMRPYSGQVLDLAMQLGFSKPYLAVDDTHYYTFDLFSGFIYVKADECTQSAITDAIRRGDFYATQGPKIYDFSITENICSVDFSPANHIQFFTNLCWHPANDYGDAIIEHAEFKIMPNDTFVRAEITGEDGKMAWTSPILIK